MSYAALARKSEREPAVKPRASDRKSSALTIGERNNFFEQEADCVADAVMAGGAIGSKWSFTSMGLNAPLRRKGAECEEEEKRTLRRKPEGGAPARHVGEAPPIVHEVLSSTGQPLDAGCRAFFESRFGRDFSHVRVHADSLAAKSARTIGARAYTAGGHIAFAAGEFSPSAPRGRGLLTHELTHVVQQERAGRRDLVQRQEAPGAASKAPPTRYAPDPKAWNEPAALLPVVESELPHVDFTPPDADHIRAGIYRIVPQLTNGEPPHVSFYIAYNTRAKRSEFAIGPEYLDFFINHMTLYMIAAGNFFGLTGQTPRYQVESAKVMHLGFKGDLGGAVRALGRSWLAALQDPGWWAQAAGAHAGLAAPEAAAGGEVEGAGAGRVPQPKAAPGPKGQVGAPVPKAAAEGGEGAGAVPPSAEAKPPARTPQPTATTPETSGTPADSSLAAGGKPAQNPVDTARAGLEQDLAAERSTVAAKKAGMSVKQWARSRAGATKRLYNLLERRAVLARMKVFPGRTYLEQAEILGVRVGSKLTAAAEISTSGTGRIADILEVDGPSATLEDLKSPSTQLKSIKGGMSSPDVDVEFRSSSEIAKQQQVERQVVAEAKRTGGKVVVKGRDPLSGASVEIELDPDGIRSRVTDYTDIGHN